MATKQQYKALNLEPYIFFEVKNLIFRHFSKIWKFSNPCDIINSNLRQKRTKLYAIFQLWWKNQIQQLWFFWGDIWYYGPLVIPLSNVILKLGQKRPNVIYLYYWWKKIKTLCKKKGKPLPNCTIKKIRAVFPKEEGHIYVTCSNVWFYISICHWDCAPLLSNILAKFGNSVLLLYARL